MFACLFLLQTAPLRLVYTVYEKAPKKRKFNGTAEMARVLKQARMTIDEEDRMSRSHNDKQETGTEIASKCVREKEKQKNKDEKDKTHVENNTGAESESESRNGKKKVCENSDSLEGKAIVKESANVGSTTENGKETPKPDENVSPMKLDCVPEVDSEVSKGNCDSVFKVKDKKQGEGVVTAKSSTPKKPKLLEKSATKNVLNGKYSPKLNHNGKVFSPTFYRKHKAYITGNDEPLDMTKKTLKEAKKSNGFSPTKPHYEHTSVINSSLYPAYEFTD